MTKISLQMSTFELSSPSEIKVKILFLLFCWRRKRKENKSNSLWWSIRWEKKCFFHLFTHLKMFFVHARREERNEKHLSSSKQIYSNENRQSNGFSFSFLCRHRKTFHRISSFEFVESKSLCFCLLSSDTLLFDIFVLLKSYSKEFDMKTEDSWSKSIGIRDGENRFSKNLFRQPTLLS